MEPIRSPRLPELPELIGSLLQQDPELARSLDRLNLSVEELIQLTEPHLDGIIRSATPEAEQLSIAEFQLEQAVRRPAAAVEFALPPGAIRNRWLVAAGIASLVVGISLEVAMPTTWWSQFCYGSGLLILAYALVRWLFQRRAERARQALQGSEIAILRQRVQAAWAARWTALVDRGLRPIVLQIRSRRDSPAYTTRFRYISARGLSAIFDPSLLEVVTPGVKQIRDFLDSTPGGSIGLAGPRGTGKSTLIASFVEGRSLRSDNQRGRAVQVSAPVEYVPRDFILHVFATLCQSVIMPPPRSVSPEPAAGWRQVGHPGWRGRFVALALSVLFVVVGAGLSLPVIFGLPDPDWRLVGGVALAAFGLLILGAVATERLLTASDSRLRGSDGRGPVKPRGGVSPQTALFADQCLQLIRYQQTYTSGWSGSVKAGVGGFEVDGGLTGGVARARNTLSLPEIVVLFKEFVTELTATGPVIIGIDELDKIATAERAQAFLNDIKSLFGVHQCYFLISISEDALSSFERRGLPLRDAFDSSLDDVVRVRPLDYPTALKLVRGRVIGLSSPYSALAYCLGGGLPREIIRWTRALVLARASVGDGLKELAHHVVGEDIGRKVFASMLALSRQPSPDSAVALQVLGDLVPVADAEWLLEQFSTRREFPSRTDARHAFSSSSPRPVSTTDDGHHAAVVDELFAYFYFCATVLEVFTDELDEDDFGRLTGALAEPAGIDQLVHARQCFSSSPDLAVSEVTAFRGRWGLRCATAAAA